MVNSINCPKCNHEFPLSDGLTQKIEEQIIASLSEQHKKDLFEARQKEREQVKKEIAEDFNAEVLFLKKQLEQKNEKVEQYLKQELTLREEKEKLEEEKREVELTIARRMDEERKKAGEEARRTVAEEYRMRERDKDQYIEGLKKALEEAQRKANQTSPQLQGEVLEIDVEQHLQRAFPHDQIEEIAKGQNGADIVQVVKSPVQGVICGKILWECKRTKTFETAKYIAKVKEDKLRAKADIGIIVSLTLPKEAVNGMGCIEMPSRVVCNVRSSQRGGL